MRITTTCAALAGIAVTVPRRFRGAWLLSHGEVRLSSVEHGMAPERVVNSGYIVAG